MYILFFVLGRAVTRRFFVLVFSFDCAQGMGFTPVPDPFGLSIFCV